MWSKYERNIRIESFSRNVSLCFVFNGSVDKKFVHYNVGGAKGCKGDIRGYTTRCKLRSVKSRLSSACDRSCSTTIPVKLGTQTGHLLRCSMATTQSFNEALHTYQSKCLCCICFIDKLPPTHWVLAV